MMRKTQCPECGVQVIWMPTRKFPHVETMVEALSVNHGDIEFHPDHHVPHLPKCPAFVYHCQLCGETAYGVTVMILRNGEEIQRDGVFCRACAKQHQPMEDRPKALHNREFCLMHMVTKEDACDLPLPITAEKDP